MRITMSRAMCIGVIVAAGTAGGLWLIRREAPRPAHGPIDARQVPELQDRRDLRKVVPRIGPNYIDVPVKTPWREDGSMHTPGREVAR